MINPSDEIYTMLVRKRKVFDEFLSVTGLLRHALEDEDLVAVNRLIERRDELIPIIDDINNNIRQGQADRGSFVDERMREVSECLYERLMQITAVNQECNTIAASRCEDLKKEMATVHQNEEGLHVYAGKTQGIPKFLSVRT